MWCTVRLRRNAIERVRTAPLGVLQNAVKKLLDKAKKLLGERGGNPATPGFGAVTFVPTTGGTEYRLWLTVDSNRQIHIMRQAQDGRSVAAELNTDADLGNLTADVKRQVVEFVAKIKAAVKKLLDPYGLSLENYDAIGAWREKQNGEGIRGAQAPKIDPSGELKSGRKFTTLEQYKAALVDEKEKFAKAFAEKVLTYALCRPVGYVDRVTVDELSAALAKNDYRIQPLIRAIVASDVFRTK